MALALIQIMPNRVANWLMNTAQFDGGEFWLLLDPKPQIKVVAVVLLSLTSTGYLALVFLMVVPDKCIQLRQQGQRGLLLVRRVTNMAIIKPETSQRSIHQVNEQVPARVDSGPRAGSWTRLRQAMTSPEGRLRRFHRQLLDGQSPVVDLPKLVFQTLTLSTYLSSGFPTSTIYFYSCLLFTNWAITSYRYSRERSDPNFVAQRLYNSFDMFFAVFAPMEVLISSYYNFEFDRDEFATRVESIRSGSFDVIARLFADPTEISVFRIAFLYLQFLSVPALLLRIFLNFLTQLKWMRTIVHLVENHRALSTSTLSTTRLTRNSHRQKNLLNTFVPAVFFCTGAAIFVHSMVAVASTNRVCAPHPHCAVPSYRWNVGAEHCSCIVFVNRFTRITTFAEWEYPQDTTAELAALAKTGHLRIIQIVNRALPTFPEELRGCHDVEQLILIYSKTVRIPDWAKEWTKMKYFHIEGDFTPNRLTYMPDDLFTEMHDLTFIHLGCLVSLPRVPSLHSQTKLQYLALAMLHSVTEFPSFSSLINLHSLNMADDILVQKLPSLASLKNLQQFALVYRSPTCCNGYLTGTCDLSDFSCKPRVGEPTVQCTHNRIPADELVLANAAKVVICTKNLTFDLKDGRPTVASTDEECGGVMFKQCKVPSGATGICFTARMMAITCDAATGYEHMRRLQIARGIGEPCDPKVEAWLGCI